MYGDSGWEWSDDTVREPSSARVPDECACVTHLLAATALCRPVLCAPLAVIEVGHTVLTADRYYVLPYRSMSSVIDWV